MPGNPISCKLFIFALISFNAVFIAVVSGLLIFTGVGSFTTSAGPGSAKANNKCVYTSPEPSVVEFEFVAVCAAEPAAELVNVEPDDAVDPVNVVVIV